MKNNKNTKLIILITVLALFIGGFGTYLLFTRTNIFQKKIVTTNKNVTITDNGLSEAVEKLYDAVVVVESYNNLKLVSSGSGFVYKVDKNDSYILTNNHVIDSATEVKVTFTSGTTETVEIVGKDTFSDIAVLKLSKKVSTVASIGSSEKAKLGDTVFTVGAPLDNAYSGSVTRGIVSGKNRMVAVSLSNTNTSDYIMKVIQTDASINSGNSGGPLANANGEVIGITNMKLVSNGVEGIGFAIPIEDALEYAKVIENGGKIERPVLGITMLNPTDIYSIYSSGLNIDTNISGVIVSEVAEKSAASEAGLRKGDIIVAIEDNKVSSIAELRYYLYKYKIGDKIKIKYNRNNKEQTTEVKLKSS